MNRRRFLQLGSAAMAGLIYDPELMLWRPPKTLITVPAMPVVYRGVSIAQLVAATYDKVIAERVTGTTWNDTAMTRYFAEQALRDPKTAEIEVRRAPMRRENRARLNVLQGRYGKLGRGSDA